MTKQAEMKPWARPKKEMQERLLRNQTTAILLEAITSLRADACLVREIKQNQGQVFRG